MITQGLNRLGGLIARGLNALGIGRQVRPSPSPERTTRVLAESRLAGVALDVRSVRVQAAVVELAPPSIRAAAVITQLPAKVARESRRVAVERDSRSASVERVTRAARVAADDRSASVPRDTRRTGIAAETRSTRP